jgi:hypothetical protein
MGLGLTTDLQYRGTSALEYEPKSKGDNEDLAATLKEKSQMHRRARCKGNGTCSESLRRSHGGFVRNVVD